MGLGYSPPPGGFTLVMFAKAGGHVSHDSHDLGLFTDLTDVSSHFQASWGERTIQQARYDPRIAFENISLNSLDVLQVVVILQHLSILVSLSDLDRWLRRSPPESGTDICRAKLTSCKYVYVLHFHPIVSICFPFTVRFAEWVGWTLGAQLMSCSSLCDGGLWRPPVGYPWAMRATRQHTDQALKQIFLSSTFDMHWTEDYLLAR